MWLGCFNTDGVKVNYIHILSERISHPDWYHANELTALVSASIEVPVYACITLLVAGTALSIALPSVPFRAIRSKKFPMFCNRWLVYHLLQMIHPSYSYIIDIAYMFNWIRNQTLKTKYLLSVVGLAKIDNQLIRLILYLIIRTWFFAENYRTIKYDLGKPVKKSKVKHQIISLKCSSTTGSLERL